MDKETVFVVYGWYDLEEGITQIWGVFLTDDDATKLVHELEREEVEQDNMSYAQNYFVVEHELGSVGNLLGAAIEQDRVGDLKDLGIKPQVIRLLRKNGVDLRRLCSWFAESRKILYRNVRLLEGFGPVRTQQVARVVIRYRHKSPDH